YSMQFMAEVNAKSMDARVKLFVSAATRQAFEFGPPLLLSADNLEQIGEERERTTIPQNVDKFLAYIRLKCPRPGEIVLIEPEFDYTVIDSLGPDELNYVTGYAMQEDLVRS